MNCEGWSNEVGLDRSINWREDGSHVGMAVLVSGRLGLQQATTDRDWNRFARWVSRDGGVGSEMGLSLMKARTCAKESHGWMKVSWMERPWNERNIYRCCTYFEAMKKKKKKKVFLSFWRGQHVRCNFFFGKPYTLMLNRP